ncbi:hypothetical protein AC578_1123 [Pseudocercospora eumusae]|uniref:Uncharacterized protein n=1 Tax=Pseudocercospora eumusae TaxID=321146 RepID=A0A139GXG0_9PEZI|nr:hypothetical protein AC578_1123 [Pseudocercospora eumusae]
MSLLELRLLHIIPTIPTIVPAITARHLHLQQPIVLRLQTLMALSELRVLLISSNTVPAPLSACLRLNQGSTDSLSAFETSKVGRRRSSLPRTSVVSGEEVERILALRAPSSLPGPPPLA